MEFSCDYRQKSEDFRENIMYSGGAASATAACSLAGERDDSVVIRIGIQKMEAVCSLPAPGEVSG